MKSDRVLLDQDPSVRAELVHESGRTRVTRLFVARRTVIRKEPLGPDAQQRVTHERAMLTRLQGVEGIVRLVDAPQDPGSIVMEDVGGRSLAGVAKPLAAERLISLAVSLAQAVAAMHRRGVLHRNITPANVVLADDGTPCLVDFALATWFAELRPEFTHQSEIAGTLVYLAPEQTGRTGRPVDQRADLYALGVTLYELATGAPPFGSGDPLRLVHDHLARVPVPPVRLNPALPVPLSAIVLHLLEKEPDDRYQTADGLLYDLQRLRGVDAGSGPAELPVGESDVPLRLLPPSRLIGRDKEIFGLGEAFEAALAGHCRGVLVAGGPGVGKTALVDQLRLTAAKADGWFVAGKFDPYRRALEFDAIHQAFRALGRLLLAEPEDEIAGIRDRMLAAVGSNAGLLTAAVPELATLLAVPPDPGDPLTAQGRAARAGVAALRAVASRDRPVVVFLDDLQWAARTPLSVLDLVFSEVPVEGLLVVGAYRDNEVDPAHPLAVPLRRWRGQSDVRHLSLGNLPVSGSVAMVAEMLHVEPTVAESLVAVLHPRTSGNPYETVQLLNMLRHDNVLVSSPQGWRWNSETVLADFGRPQFIELLAARLETLPSASRTVLEVLACLGRAELSLLHLAIGESVGVVEDALVPALEEGLLTVESGPQELVRFRHDRIREAVLAGHDPGQRILLQLSIARRLATAPERYAAAAEQYLPVVDAIEDVAERRQVAELLRHAADQAALIGNHALVEATLAAALRVIEPGETDLLTAVHADRHAALYSLGRLEEADEAYHMLETLLPEPWRHAEATAVQVFSLTNRSRFAEAVALGVGSLRELGILVPPMDRLLAELDSQFDLVSQWLDRADAADEQDRPGITEPAVLAAGRLVNAILPAAYLAADFPTYAWLSLQAVRVWFERGPARTLIGPASLGAYAIVAMRGDHPTGYRAARRILTMGEAYGYEPGTSQARAASAILSWRYEPIEYGVEAHQRAREGLLAGADVANAGYTYHNAGPALLDCTPTLDAYVAEIDEGLAFARRVGAEQITQWLENYRWMAGALRGEYPSAAEPSGFATYAGNEPGLFYMHYTRAVVAVILDDQDGLDRHTASAMPLLPTVLGTYASAIIHVLRGLALVRQIRATSGDERVRLKSELDEVTRWTTDLAADAPDNFLHLVRLLEAERACADGDSRAAELAFDAALRAGSDRQRPWHRVLIAERAARFFFSHGLEHTGRGLLTQAYQQARVWGAMAKLVQLDGAYPTLRPEGGPAAAGAGNHQPPADLPQRSTITTGTIDLLGILSASQAISSETSFDRLHARVTEVVRALTGATDVRLILWSDDRHDWVLPESALPASTDGEGAAPNVDTGHDQMVPASALRYVQRTCKPLIVDDATADDRFAHDPYLDGVEKCSLLAVPILIRGTLKAVLLMENRLIRGAFGPERLDAVRLITGQLAVSLDNAKLYAELTASRARIVTAADAARRRIERDLHDGAQQRLVSLILKMRSAQSEAAPEARRLRERLDELAVEANGIMDDLRELARGVHPAVLTDGGLPPAMKTLARRSAIPVRLDVRVKGRLPEAVELAAYYVVAEALTNAAKHSAATVVDVEMKIDDGVLRVRIRDDGRGGANLSGSGLVGLKDRVEALGGRLDLLSPHGAGTVLRIALPLSPPGFRGAP